MIFDEWLEKLDARESAEIVRRFLNDRERFLEQLFRPDDNEPALFD